MLIVEGQKPDALWRRLLEHGSSYRPVVDSLVYSLLFESTLARDEHVHVIRQHRNGASSFSVRSAVTGDEWHFRPGGNGSILVYDRYRNSNLVAVLKNKSQSRRFARSLL